MILRVILWRDYIRHTRLALTVRLALVGAMDTGEGTAAYQIVSTASGMCIGEAAAKAATAATATTTPAARAAGAAGVTAPVVFDVASVLGWKNGARVRDLVAHADLGVKQKISVQLHGDGDSKIYRLTPVV